MLVLPSRSRVPAYHYQQLRHQCGYKVRDSPLARWHVSPLYAQRMKRQRMAGEYQAAGSQFLLAHARFAWNLSRNLLEGN